MIEALAGDHEAELLARYRRVLERLERAVAEAGRKAGSVGLVAVGKTHPAERMRPLLACGHRMFGENRVQEAEEKWPALRAEWPDIELHLIGPLQTNKVRQAVALFDVVETVDRPKLAEALAAEMQRADRRLRCFVQVNTGEERQKAGVLPSNADQFIEDCRQVWGLSLAGLMCIPPVDQDPTPHFRCLAEIAKRHRQPALSMGMSADYRLAIKAGATHVRVGTAIFGRRSGV